MGWVRRGQIFEADGQAPWTASRHAQLPLPLALGDGRLRVYFSSRDEQNRSRSGFFETEADEPARIVRVHDRPALELGEPGAFDDRGVVAASLVEAGDELHMYYIGYTAASDVPYVTNVGLAVSSDGGVSFTRRDAAPVLELGASGAVGANSPFVLRDGGRWRMWYGAVTGWDRTSGRPEPMYEIRHAESSDGVRWQLAGAGCIEPRYESEANTRAWVLRDGGTYRMWFCYRAVLDFRENPEHGYRVGYAESGDGVRWERRDEEAGTRAVGRRLGL